MTATIEMASILPRPPPRKVIITREVFERICAPAFERIKLPLRQVLCHCCLLWPETTVQQCDQAVRRLHEQYEATPKLAHVSMHVRQHV